MNKKMKNDDEKVILVEICITMMCDTRCNFLDFGHFAINNLINFDFLCFADNP